MATNEEQEAQDEQVAEVTTQKEETPERDSGTGNEERQANESHMCNIDAQLEALREVFHNFLCHAIPKDSPTFDSLLGKVRPILEQWAQKVADYEQRLKSEFMRNEEQWKTYQEQSKEIAKEVKAELEGATQYNEKLCKEVARLRECKKQLQNIVDGLDYRVTNNVVTNKMKREAKAALAESEDE